ncbi:hypothetical protein TYRP_002991 [Tyrophagus putrescentiae]|nr:hypothetical protein TYRP_002991 [Tyrophagus putrescentiae]
MEIAEFEQLIDSNASDQVEVEVEVENVEDIDELQQQKQPVSDEQPMAEIAELEQPMDSSASDQVEVEVEVEVENVEDIDELQQQQQQQQLPNEDYDDSSNIDNSIPVEETAAIEKEAETVAEGAAAEVEAEVIEVSANVAANPDDALQQQQPQLQQQQQPFEAVPVALSGSPDTVPINENEQVDSSPSLVPCSPSSYITVSPSLSSPSPSSSPSSSSSAFSGSANINTIESNNSTGDESTAKDAADELASDQAASQSLKESAADKLSAQVVVDSNATAATDGEEESDDEMDENDEEEDLNENEGEYEDDDNEDDYSEAADVPADAAAAAAVASAPVFPDPQVIIDLPPVYRQQNDSSLRKRSAPSAETVRNEYDQQGDFGEDSQDSLDSEDSPSEEDLYRFSVKRLRKRPEELLLTSNDPMLSSTPLCHNSNFRLYNPSPANARVFALLPPPPPPPPPGVPSTSSSSSSSSSSSTICVHQGSAKLKRISPADFKRNAAKLEKFAKDYRRIAVKLEETKCAVYQKKKPGDKLLFLNFYALADAIPNVKYNLGQAKKELGLKDVSKEAPF